MTEFLLFYLAVLKLITLMYGFGHKCLFKPLKKSHNELVSKLGIHCNKVRATQSFIISCRLGQTLTVMQTQCYNIFCNDWLKKIWQCPAFPSFIINGLGQTYFHFVVNWIEIILHYPNDSVGSFVCIYLCVCVHLLKSYQVT